MKTVWKVLLGLALVVPLCAFVAGSLAASASDDPAQRHTIQIQEPSPTRTPTRSPTKTPTPTASPDGDVEVITPHYDDFGDDHGGDDSSGHGGGDDNSGHGGGDDNSGHGGGGGSDG
jgi:hypothetical protein